MTKNDFISGVVANVDTEAVNGMKITKKLVEAILDATETTIYDTVKSNADEKIKVFGVTFGQKVIPARSGNSPVGGAWTKPEHSEMYAKLSKSKRAID